MINTKKTDAGSEAAPDTRTRILDAAEQLFSTKGIQGISVRTILSEAGINAALAHYHFGSRDGLIQQVLQRRIDPLNRKRLELLDEALASAEADNPELSTVLRAFFTPVVDLLEERPDFARLLGQLHVAPDPKLREFFIKLFGEVIRRFADAVRNALPPGLPRPQKACRAHFTLGVLIHTLTNYSDLKLMARGRYSPLKREDLLEEMVRYCTAGLVAPLPPSSQAN